MSTTEAAVLPPEFSDLEPWADWSIPSDHERYMRRLDSSMQELEEFYGAAAPRIPEALEYLDRFELKDMPESARRLMWLLFSVTTVSFAVDIFRQPKIPDSGPAYIRIVREPTP